MNWWKGKTSSGFTQTTQRVSVAIVWCHRYLRSKENPFTILFFAIIIIISIILFNHQEITEKCKRSRCQDSSMLKARFCYFFAISCLILKRPILPLFQLPWPPALIFSTVLIAAAPPSSFAPVLKGAQVRNVFKALKLALWCPQAVRNRVNLKFFYHW